MSSVKLVLALTAGVVAAAQSAPQRRAPQRMEIHIELRDGSAWRAVDPSHVFAQGDRVRFRYRSNFNGYLYVMNQGTSGDYGQLFPREDTGTANRVEAGKEYVVPAAAEGAFRVTGPPGHDIIYWMVTPLALGEAAPKYLPLPPPPKSPPPPANITPRCDDAVFKARGECVDNSAGPKPVASRDKLPGNLAGTPNLSSRELLFIREQKRAVVSSPEPMTGPVIYEFRLAHR
ncbi:MAG: DUF4384 domain-containing protein [Acidobacteria bacterium]|nr:DUF4384 domain-containing protein [Acidobacteriota bacterium]